MSNNYFNVYVLRDGNVTQYPLTALPSVIETLLKRFNYQRNKRYMIYMYNTSSVSRLLLLLLVLVALHVLLRALCRLHLLEDLELAVVVPHSQNVQPIKRIIFSNGQESTDRW